MRSTRTTSGRRARAIATASVPSPASPMTCRSGWLLRNTRRPCLTTVWSSAIQTRIGSATARFTPAGGYHHVDARTRRRRADLERRADRRGPLAHAGQAETGGRARAAGRQALPVVGDDQSQLVRLDGECDGDPAGGGVAAGVRQGFLDRKSVG